ncbi:hypothetical protein KUTeg_003416 [Tegillarca granosa]|uniref:Uncharacterized protein n=1 Tax=Tegillarca granosa TaxID=220873 RepID=A0ABQ9FPZ5_TEGGR|nr:hypothetical protein KUTeg_003416 [Tegillarca granosa]
MADPNQMPVFRPNGPVSQGPIGPHPGQNDRVNTTGNIGQPVLGATGKNQQLVNQSTGQGMMFHGQGLNVSQANEPHLYNNVINHQNGFSTPLTSSFPQGMQQNIQPQGQSMGPGNRMPGPQNVPNGPMNLPPHGSSSSTGVRPPYMAGQMSSPLVGSQNVTAPNISGNINTYGPNTQGIRPPLSQFNQSNVNTSVATPSNFNMSQNRNVGPPPQVGSSGPPRPMGLSQGPPTFQRQAPPTVVRGQGQPSVFPGQQGIPPTAKGQVPPLMTQGSRMRPPMSGLSSQPVSSGSQNMTAGPPSSNQGMPPFITEPPIGQMTGPSTSETPAVGLPVPFHGHGQYSHQVDNKLTPGLTPNNSEPPSQKSSRTNTPDMSQNFDALEGQFTGAQRNQPMMYAQPPSSTQEMEGRSGGITGPRKYPQMPNSMNQTPTSQWQQQSSTQYPQLPPQMPQTSFPGPPVSMGYGQQPTYQQSPGIVPPQNLAGPPGPGSFPLQTQSSQQPSNKVNYQSPTNALSNNFGAMGLQEGHRILNLMNEKQLIPPDGIETPKPKLPTQHDYKKVNCSSDVFRCTLTSLPQTSSLLNKCRLPLGILIHPFKDLSQLPVIQSSVIVRCRSCRTYINPFVFFVDQLPDEFSFDPVSKTYGDPQRRPEVKSATIEFIAPSEYMILLEELDKVPGDSRTLIGFLAFDRALHFFNLAEGLSQPQMLIVSDLDDVFLPCPDDLLVNLQESKELVIDLLNQLPSMFEGNMETGSALGAALQAAFKLTTSTGGRVSVFQTVLPSVGPGALQSREDPSQRTSKNIGNLGPATDFYKKIALDCSAQQIAVDLFMLNGQYADLATISCVSKYSGGCIYYYPSFHSVKNPSLADKFEADLRRYLTRKIGFESVMRIRCSKGERRIRVHTMCLPVTNQISEVFAGADQQAIVALLAKMAVDRSVTSSLTDAREAMINAAHYGNTIPASQRIGAVPSPFSIRLLPTFVLAMLKSTAFRLGTNTSLDDRVFAMQQCKSLPTSMLLQNFYANMYPVHNLDDMNEFDRGDVKVPQPPRLHLSSANIDRHGVFLIDTGDSLLLYVGSAVPDKYLQDVLDVPNFMSIPEDMIDLPELENPTSEKLRSFVSYLLDCRPGGTTFYVIREDSKYRMAFFQHMVEDRTESSMSYYEFLQHLQKQIKS